MTKYLFFFYSESNTTNEPEVKERARSCDNYECGDCGDFFPSKEKLFHHLPTHIDENEDDEEEYGDDEQEVEESPNTQVKKEVDLNAGKNENTNELTHDECSDEGQCKRQTRSAAKEQGHTSGKPI